MNLRRKSPDKPTFQFAGLSRNRNKTGFTLIEVLVAMVITAMAVTVFFQILSAGMRLEFASSQRTGDVVNLRHLFASVVSRDIRDPGLEWEGEHQGGYWSLRLEQVETMKTHMDSEETLNIDSELYRFFFEYKTEEGRVWTLVRYAQYEPDFFGEDFKRRHFP